MEPTELFELQDIDQAIIDLINGEANITILGRTKQQFINECSIIHNYKYDYSLLNQTQSLDFITIICPDHGQFTQLAYYHIRGHGCARCKTKRHRGYTTDVFLARSRAVHGNNYCYDKTTYSSYNDRVVITCLRHGDFRILPTNHLKGKGCPKC